nr:hypothetical protein [Tanacetum cinerariifolium]
MNINTQKKLPPEIAVGSPPERADESPEKVVAAAELPESAVTYT